MGAPLDPSAPELGIIFTRRLAPLRLDDGHSNPVRRFA
jgi:hypothetical protein